MTLKLSALFAGIGLLVIGGQAQAANPDHVRQLLQTNRCPGCDLSGASLRGLDLQGADLEQADLSGVRLNQSNLSRAKLRKANLQNASITGTNFNGADLSQANFSNASNDLCQFGDSNGALGGCLSFSVLRSLGEELCEPEYELRNLKDFETFCTRTGGAGSLFYFSLFAGAWFRPFSVQGANLQETNFNGVDLTGSDFRYSDIDQTNFEGAKLRYALFLETDTSRANNANFKDAFVTVADVRDAIKAEIAKEEQQRQQRETRINLGIYSRAQQAYRLENNRFAAKLSDLDTQIVGEHFDYTIVSQADPARYVVIQATSKTDGLHNASSLVYFDQDQFQFVICETESLTQGPPNFTELPTQPEEPLQCPAGSRKLE